MLWWRQAEVLHDVPIGRGGMGWMGVYVVSCSDVSVVGS